MDSKTSGSRAEAIHQRLQKGEVGDGDAPGEPNKPLNLSPKWALSLLLMASPASAPVGTLGGGAGVAS